MMSLFTIDVGAGAGAGAGSGEWAVGNFIADSRLPTAFAYDAVEPKNRRKAPAIRVASEDKILDSGKRAKLLANTRDIHRNFAIAAWAIRRHLDYVSSFGFHARTKDKGLNAAIEGQVADWSLPANFDVARRHGRGRFIRLLEARAVLDGDIGVMKLRSGQAQAIEGDRIKGDGVHGVAVDAGGGALAYHVHQRTDAGGLMFERTVPADNLILHGYFDRFDQVRGISPLAPGINALRDVYENLDYATAKAKVTSLFALAFYREATEGAGDIANDGALGTEKGAYEIDFGRGPVLLDLDPGDRAEFLESKHPDGNLQVFLERVIAIALKALDIPYSFYDEAHTNFFGSRGAWLHYERACGEKRAALQELLRQLTLWQLSLRVLDGRLVLPSSYPTVEDLVFEWVPDGMPWWDPAKEIRGDLAAIGAGLDNPQRITKERGRGDFYDNIDAIAEAQAYAKDKGVKLSFDFATSDVEEAAAAAVDEANDKGGPPK